MKSTFLVEIDVPDTDLIGYAEDIQNDLMAVGHEVLSCKPWAHPTLGATAPAFGAVSLPTPPDASGN